MGGPGARCAGAAAVSVRIGACSRAVPYVSSIMETVPRSRPAASRWLVAVVMLVLSGCTAEVGGLGSPEQRPTAPGAHSTAPAVPAAPESSGVPAPGTGAPKSDDHPGAPDIPPPMEKLLPPDEPDVDEVAGARQVDASGLLEALTSALQEHDRTAFRSHFEGEAQQRATLWWDNLDAIGFDGGAVSMSPLGENLFGKVVLDADGVGHLWDVLAGTHFPGDEVDLQGRLIVPTSRYQWQVRAEPGTGDLTVIGWTSLERVPWDCACALQVRQGADGVLVTYPDEVGITEATLDDLDRASSWTRDFLERITEPRDKINNLLGTGGVVVFATTDTDRMLTWFSPARTEEPYEGLGEGTVAYVTLTEGYFGDRPDLVGGQTYQGSRMVVLVDEEYTLEPTLVHELIHYALSRLDRVSPFVGSHPYIIEGIAEMVSQIAIQQYESDYRTLEQQIGTPGMAPNTTPDLVEKSFHGDVPTADQLRSDDGQTVGFAYDVSASVYSYLALEFGLPTAFVAAECAYRTADLFSCVPDTEGATSRSGEFVDTLPAETVKADWAAWFRKNYG